MDVCTRHANFCAVCRKWRAPLSTTAVYTISLMHFYTYYLCTPSLTSSKMGRRKKRKTTHTIDEDDLPLQAIIRKSSCDNNANSYDSLRVPSNQPCELCDHVAKNRYRSLIHNVKHIIIPLINQTVFQCEICLHHFTSQSDLNQHISQKHSESELVTLTDLVNFNNPADELFDSDLITIVKKEYVVSPEPTVENNSKEFSLKSRLLFEEDISPLNCDRLLADLTTDCKVNVEWFPPVWDLKYPKSIHYDELIKPGVFRCKKCGRSFPSRYEAIKHEARHFHIKNSQVTLCRICNRYILGDEKKLKHHIKTSHSKSLFSKLRYEEPADAKKYFGGKPEENGVVDEPYVTKITTLKLCDMCYSFCKNKSTLNYICVGELNEIGKRHSCQKCGVKFFVVKLVTLETKYKYSSFAHKKNKKGITNEDRLKMIRQRFKMMKTY